MVHRNLHTTDFAVRDLHVIVNKIWLHLPTVSHVFLTMSKWNLRKMTQRKKSMSLGKMSLGTLD